MDHNSPNPLDETTNSHSARANFLNGWKDIANYLGRGVRTVQRWEALGLPVRRPNSRLRSAVLSTAEEIDAWLEQCGNGRSDALQRLSGAPTDAYGSLLQQLVGLRDQIEQLRTENRLLRRHLDELHTVKELPLEREASTDAA